MPLFRSRRDREEKRKNRRNDGTVMSRFGGFFRSMFSCTSSSGSRDNVSFEVEWIPQVQVEDDGRSPQSCDGGKTSEGVPWRTRFPGEGKF